MIGLTLWPTPAPSRSSGRATARSTPASFGGASARRGVPSRRPAPGPAAGRSRHDRPQRGDRAVVARVLRRRSRPGPGRPGRRVGMSSGADQPFGTLSAGERRRVSIARALMPDPDLLLLDEPAASLDLAARETLLADLTALAAEPRPAGIVLVSHHLEEIPPGFDHALVLAARPGRGRRSGRPACSPGRSCPRRTGCRCSSNGGTAEPGRDAMVPRRQARIRTTRHRHTERARCPRDHHHHPRRHRRRHGRRRRASAASELLAGLLPGRDLAVAAVGQFVVDHQPPGAKDVVVVALRDQRQARARDPHRPGRARLRGRPRASLAARRFEVAALGFGAFGVAGLPRRAAATRGVARHRRRSPRPPRSASGCGSWAGSRHPGRAAGARPAARGRCPTGPAGRSSSGPGRWGRRRWSPGIGGRALLERQRTPRRGRRSACRRRPTSPRSSIRRNDLSTSVPELTPIVMPNDRFYRIDTALLIPTLDTASWTLRIHGLVDRETTLTWDELLGLPMFEQYVTIACVSNEVGGKLVGNAKWTGVRLREVLEMAGVQASATQLVGPIRRRLDGRHADGLGDGPGPRADDRGPDERPAPAAGARLSRPAHRPGPVRLRVGDQVAGRAGADDARVVRRLLGAARLVEGGADPDAVAHRHARRTAPASRPDACRSPGSPGRPIAASRRSRSRSTAPGARPGCHGPISDATWVQWVLDWDATPGDHTIAVRATDGTGTVQEERQTPPAPDGARGWHTIAVRVG